jgi:preprotein translocase subunit Sss1
VVDGVSHRRELMSDIIGVTALGLLVGGTIGVLIVMLGELLWIWI